MRDNIMHHQMHTLDSPSVITFSTERPRMLVSWSFIAQNAPTESCRCTTRIPWYHQNPAYTHRILFALTACIWIFDFFICSLKIACVSVSHQIINHLQKSQYNRALKTMYASQFGKRALWSSSTKPPRKKKLEMPSFITSTRLCVSAAALESTDWVGGVLQGATCALPCDLWHCFSQSERANRHVSCK